MKPARETATLRRAGQLDDLLVFAANYRKFQFARHAHEDFALGLMEGGAQTFHCCGADNCAAPGSLITVNADTVHDGRSADGGEYRYRIIYIPAEMLQAVGGEMVAPGRRHRFGSPVVNDSELAGRLSLVFSLLDSVGTDLLELHSLFYGVVADLLERYGEVRVVEQSSGVPEAVGRACEYINDNARKNIQLQEIADSAGLSRYHFLRVFSQSQGMTPHAYLLLRRLQLAKEDIRKGAAIVDAALEAGFADQSHFTRRFKAAYGVTPKQFKNAVR